jgi:hypothetical protein
MLQFWLQACHMASQRQLAAEPSTQRAAYWNPVTFLMKPVKSCLNHADLWICAEEGPERQHAPAKVESPPHILIVGERKHRAVRSAATQKMRHEAPAGERGMQEEGVTRAGSSL